MRARTIRQVGVRGKLRVYWDETVGKKQPCKDCPEGFHVSPEYQNTCPNTYGTGKPGIHNAYTPIGDKLGTTEWGQFGKAEDFAEEQWPTACADCGAPVPKGTDYPTAEGERAVYLRRQVSESRLYDSPSGNPEPGDVYYLQWHDPGECPHWDNCDGTHVYAITPNGVTWDIDGRASNCTMREERTHRCWVRVGSLEDGTLHIDKNGHTCAAGAGSIAVEGWHGFLNHFSWNGC